MAASVKYLLRFPLTTLKISGILSSVSDNDLEDVVCKAITKAGVEVSDKDIVTELVKGVQPASSFVKERFQSKF